MTGSGVAHSGKSRRAYDWERKKLPGLQCLPLEHLPFSLLFHGHHFCLCADDSSLPGLRPWNKQALSRTSFRSTLKIPQSCNMSKFLHSMENFAWLWFRILAPKQMHWGGCVKRGYDCHDHKNLNAYLLVARTTTSPPEPPLPPLGGLCLPAWQSSCHSIIPTNKNAACEHNTENNEKSNVNMHLSIKHCLKHALVSDQVVKQDRHTVLTSRGRTQCIATRSSTATLSLYVNLVDETLLPAWQPPLLSVLAM